MERKKYVVLVAGGSGTRMGACSPKQFLLLGGVPVLQRTLSRFAEACPDAAFITVLPKEHFRTWKDLCIEYCCNEQQTLVAGGLTRFHSVRGALEAVPPGALVAIHDGVRPLVSVSLIKEMFARMDSCRALIPVIPEVDTLKCLDTREDGSLTVGGPDPDRGRVFRAQTPQLFRSEEIKAAYGQAFDLSFTDDASVASRAGIPLSFIMGERRNIKITTPSDLEFASLLLGL